MSSDGQFHSQLAPPSSPGAPATTFGRSFVSLLLSGIALPLACLLPFLNKAFHIDDTVFIWCARQIRQHPTDFFGFAANWYGHDMPMANINMNPPGVSYLIALASAVFGESEMALHAVFLLPAVAMSAGTWMLARRWSPSSPALATLCCVLTPGYVVSSTNLMSDTLMCAFYVWAIVFWVEGIERKSATCLVLSALTIACSMLTKYFGITLVPLLATYSLIRLRRPGVWSLVLLIPVCILAAYQFYTRSLYGSGVFGNAAGFALRDDWRSGFLWPLDRGVTSLSFTGACLAASSVVSIASTRARVWIASLALAGAGVGLVWLFNCPTSVSLAAANVLTWPYLGQWVVWTTMGLIILYISIADVVQKRDVISVTLLLWIVGTFAFASTINWTTAARTILPMTPAAGILVARRMNELRILSVRRLRWLAALGLAAAASLTMLVSWSDYRLADSGRQAAAAIAEKTHGLKGQVWFSGHLGFQLYMEKIGAKPVNFYMPVAGDGDTLVVPRNNYAPVEIPWEVAQSWFNLTFPGTAWLSTMDKQTGAGFYCSEKGPLPFVVGASLPEEYEVYRIDLGRLFPNKSPAPGDSRSEKSSSATR